MRCFVCAREGIHAESVSICRHCGVAMCMTHLVELQATRPGGTDLGCNHVIPSSEDAAIGRRA